MNPVRPPLPNLIPESAPFTPEQRVWLNGFFAGLLSLDGGLTPLSPEQSVAMLAGLPAMAPAATEKAEDGAPWHDQTLPLAERMQLAEGRPLRRRMMAAMGQQDCGQCGYNCEGYADAISNRSEERLNLCVPGGKETARMLKTLYAELDASPIAVKKAPAASTPATPAAPVTVAPTRVGRSRDNPVEAVFLSRTRLNKPGSEKETWHIEFDIAGTGLDYAVGDSFGVYPTNDPGLVEAVIKAVGAPADFPIAERTLRDALSDGTCLGSAPDMLFQLASYLTGGERRRKAKMLADGGDPDGDAATLDVLAAIEKFPGFRPDPEAFLESLNALQPRLYSISSSPRVHRGRVSLTIDAVRYRIDARTRLGCASTFLAERVKPGDKVRVYVQKAQHFALPADPATPIIMIGPGTGIAPFRAFLHERMALNTPGRNWLFFGHQRRNCDFFYEDELVGMRAAGHLTRLTLAWSRDAEQKIYVQHRMADVGRDLWRWIAEGAHVYVCGDAQRMAKDVERTLVDIIAMHGARSPEQAVAFLSELKKTGRYQIDVY
jgi:sulfite reductase (NADPH) flavoprotein alpha-component